MSLSVNCGGTVPAIADLPMRNPSVSGTLTGGNVTASALNASSLTLASGTASSDNGKCVYSGSALTVGNATAGPLIVPMRAFSLATSATQVNGNAASTSTSILPAARDTLSLPIGLYRLHAELFFSLSNVGTGASRTWKLKLTSAGTMSVQGVSICAIGTAASCASIATADAGTAFNITNTFSTENVNVAIKVDAILDASTACTLLPKLEASTNLTGTSNEISYSQGSFIEIEAIGATGGSYAGGWV